MATPPVGRRDRKRHATRESLIDAAFTLFEEKGFAATTVDEIAERADVAQRTFFRHFPTKESVLFPDSGEGAWAFRAALDARPRREPLLASVLGAFATAMSEIAEEDRALTARRQAILSQQGGPGDSFTWESIVVGRRIIEDAAATYADLPVTDDAVQMVASVSLLLLTQALPEWYEAGTSTDLSAILAERLERLRNVVTPSRTRR
jgi:TetR/AcrR family transcriptional regulator, regulator of mycofactocin system